MLKVGDEVIRSEWEAGRGLADGLLGFLRAQLAAQAGAWDDLSGLGVFRGPGSFTGLRIGLTVLNTIADAKGIPIVGAQGEGWETEALKRLADGQDDRLVLPLYGREANITKPRK
jgi:tRNA threonylcarbamoyladenosine biosynthesis protein TsaB